MSTLHYALLAVAFAGISAKVSAQLPAEFYDEKLPLNFSFPTGLVFDEDGRMYVWEKSGKVYIVDQEGQRLPDPLIDISEEVTNWKDHGLMGFTLDPGFLINGNFYLYYAVDWHYQRYYGTPSYSPDSTVINEPTFGRITRYTADPATGFSTTLPGSRKVLLGEEPGTGVPLLYEFHGLGSLIAGEDGTLLFSCGDATSNAGTDIGGDSLGTMITRALEYGIITPDQDVGSYRAQYLNAYNGKVLRIDPETGDGLPSNPYYDPENPRSVRSRVWALGLRNPYRIQLRPNTGSHLPSDGAPGIIYVGDVGNGGWEEIDVVRHGGQNFAWPIYEGYHIMWAFYVNDVPPNLMAPNPAYDQGLCDEPWFNFRELLLRPKSETDTLVPNPCNPGEFIPATSFPMVESLPAIAWNNSAWNPPTRAQTGQFDGNGYVKGWTLGEDDAPVQGESFDGYSSLAGVFYEGNLFPEQYRGKYFGIDFSGWIKVFDFDENQQLKSVEPFHNRAEQIIHLAQNVNDGCLYYINLMGQIRKISYGGNPPPVAVIETDQQFGPSPLSVEFDAAESEEGNAPIVKYVWDFGDGATGEGANLHHEYAVTNGDPASFMVKLTVIDSLGESGSSEQIISLNNTPPEVHIASFEDGDRYPLTGTSSLELIGEVKDKESKDEDLTYEWYVYVQHNEHFHPDPPLFEHKTHTLISPLGCIDELYWYRIELRVTDPSGLQGVDSRSIYPNCDPPFVDWTQLDGQATDKSIQLSFQTGTEQQVAVYEIQRGRNFFDFETIGRINPGETGPDGSYHFEDPSPIIGTNLYRIKAISEDRAFAYSNMINIDFPRTPDLKVFPNPAKDAVYLQLKKALAGKIRFELFDLAGSRLYTTDWTAEVNKPFEVVVPVSSLSEGCYLYRVTNGKQQYSDAIILTD